MHWGGITPRYSPEDFRLRSLYGVGDDWPFTYEELDPFYQEAEERMGVAGEQGPAEYDPRGKPYPLPPLPLYVQPRAAQGLGGRGGHPRVGHAVGQELGAARRPRRSASAATPATRSARRARSTRPTSPGTRSSPRGRWSWSPSVLVRRLEADAAHRPHRRARPATRTDATGEPVTLIANTFVLAARLRVDAAPAAALARRGAPERAREPERAGGEVPRAGTAT